MQSGRQRHRITIQQPIVVIDDYGQQSVTWQILTRAWCDIKAGRQDEFYSNETTVASAQLNFVIRPNYSITKKMRVVYRGAAYNIGEIETDYRGRRMIIKAQINE